MPKKRRGDRPDMGSEFYTYEQAAQRLDRSKRMIYVYLEKGWLKRVHRDGEVVLSKDEVEQLALELGSDAPAMNRKSFMEVFSRLRKLEEDNAVFRRMWGMVDKPLRPSRDEAIGFHAAASHNLAFTSWKAEEVSMWADQFDRMDEVFFDAVRDATVLAQPYAVFYNLCLKLMSWVSEKNAEKPDLEMQILHKRLDEGRKKMRSTILMWVEMGRGTVPEALFKKLNTEGDELLKRLILPSSKS